jgi:hypothetical protein
VDDRPQRTVCGRPERRPGAGTQFDPNVVSVFEPVARRLELAAPHQPQNAETR